MVSALRADIDSWKIRFACPASLTDKQAEVHRRMWPMHINWVLCLEAGDRKLEQNPAGRRFRRTQIISFLFAGGQSPAKKRAMIAAEQRLASCIKGKSSKNMRELRMVKEERKDFRGLVYTLCSFKLSTKT